MNNPPIPKKKKEKIWSVKQADEKFSIYIRERDAKCVRCGKIKSEDNHLTCSHFWARQHSATRYDTENCDALCWMPCHKYHWEKEKQGAYRDFKINQLGITKYRALELRAKSTKNRKEAIMELMEKLSPLST